MNLHRLTKTQADRVLAMHFVLFSIKGFVEIYRIMDLGWIISVILEVSMPIFVSSIFPCHDLLPVQIESFFSLRSRHCTMNKGLVATLDIVLRRPVSFFDFLEVFVPRVRLEVMRALNLRLEAKPFVVIKVGLCNRLQGHHEVIAC